MVPWRYCNACQRKRQTAWCRTDCWPGRQTSPDSPCRTFGTEHAGSLVRGRCVCRHRGGLGPGGTSDRRRSDGPYRKRHRLFFLPPGESDDPGSGIAKDTGYPLLGGKRRKVIGIGESPLFSHARFISHLPMPLQAEYPLPERAQ